MKHISKRLSMFVKRKRWVFLGMLLVLFFGILFKIYYDRIGKFDFFDENFNIIGGYFMLQGKTLYSEIFFNHQMLMADLSFLIQKYLRPDSLYHLILYHRLFVIVFGIVFDLLLIYRFRFVGVGFVLFYELLKFYLFGNLFLAESLIVYPLVYIFGIGYESLQKKAISASDIVFSGISTWFVIFMREPYIPLVVFLYGVTLFYHRRNKYSYISLFIFLILSVGILLSVPLSDYWVQVVSVNEQTVFTSEVESNEIGGLGFLKIFFYPLFILFPTLNHFSITLLLFDLSFIALFSFLALRKKYWMSLLYIFVALGLSNLRYVPPGSIYFAAFHMIVWFGLFLASIFLLFQNAREMSKRITIPAFIYLLIIFFFVVFFPTSYLREPLDKNFEFTRSFGGVYALGNVIKILSDGDDTLFIDRADMLLYQQAGLASSYTYATYYPVAGSIDEFKKIADEMFIESPPDFYYSVCGKKLTSFSQIPPFLHDEYIHIDFQKKPSCLYIKKTTFESLNDRQVEELQSIGYGVTLTQSEVY